MELLRTRHLVPPPFEVGEIVVDRPPEVPKAEPVSMVARLLPVAMIVAMGAMTVLYFSSGAASSRSPAFMFLPVMMLVSMLGSIAYGARGSRRSGQLDEDRRRYLRYLDELDGRLVGMAAAQHDSLHWSHPEPAALWTVVDGPRRWERRPGDVDFGQVRVGLGRVRPAMVLAMPAAGSSDARDPVTDDALTALAAERSAVPGVPVTVDLVAHRRIVVAGSVPAARGLVRAMVCQLAVLHAPDAVGIALAGRADADWDWVKWLPHHGVAGGSHRIVIVDGADGSAPDTGPAGVTALVIGGPLGGEDLLLDTDASAMFDHADAMSVLQAAVCARALARFRPESAMAVGFDDWSRLLGIEDPTRMDAWRPQVGQARLRVPIGTSDLGAAVELDLKEAAAGGMGPHGLCVGATGSGKSEFLRTLVLGLTATHGPEALNLVLVDFKGGATFLGFEGLRHIAAVVTNLGAEAHLVARMRDALAGEMTRRQEVLREAGHFASLGDYDTARAAGADLAPLPALVIVVDEFSELLSQHPDFAELFVAIGRVGRSLGMHLLLASQRLDEGRLRGLETHLSYRICLKTFSASESRAVLGTADAYELPGAPGAAFLKTAAGDLVRFRTAFVSRPLAVAVEPPEVRPMRFTLSTREPPPLRAGPSTGSRSLLDAVVAGLAGRGEPAHRVWLPPLAGSPALRSLPTAPLPPLVVPIGLVDNPFAQRRDTLMVDLRAAGGNVAVVGGPRAGKTTALHTLVVALAATHDPEQVQFYLLDLGGGLSHLSLLPHVGAIAGRFERDLARRIVAHVESLVRGRVTRRKRGAPTDADHGDVFLIVDGWAVVRQEFDGMEEAIGALATQGLSVGVHVVVAASRWADVRPALKDQLHTRIELRLGDPADSEMDRKRARLLGDRPAGHGITRDGLEFVVALPDRGTIETLGARFAGRGAPPVRLLPTRVPHADVVIRSPDHPVLGIEEDELAPLSMDFDTHPHLLVLGDTQCGKTSALRTVCREIIRTRTPDAARIVVIDMRRTLLGVVASEHLAGYAMSTAGAELQIDAAVTTLTGRLPGEHVTQAQLRDRSWWSGPDVFVVVDDYDLVAGVAGNPLTPLIELLPHAGDLGLHVILARRSGGAARAMFDPFLTRLREMGCAGLMMSASPDEGVMLGSVRPSVLPAGRGTLIRRGRRDRLVQVSWTEPA